MTQVDVFVDWVLDLSQDGAASGAQNSLCLLFVRFPKRKKNMHIIVVNSLGATCAMCQRICSSMLIFAAPLSFEQLSCHICVCGLAFLLLHACHFPCVIRPPLEFDASPIFLAYM